MVRFLERFRRIKDTQEEIFTADDERQITPILKDKEGNIKLSPQDLLGLGLILGSDGALKNLTDSNGRIQVAVPGAFGEIQRVIHIPIDNSDAAIAVTAGEIWDIILVVGELVAAGVATRSFQINVNPIPLIAIVNSVGFATSGFNVLDGQDAFILMPDESYHWKNVNGSDSVVANENPFEVPLVGGESINTTWTNKNAADRSSLRVLYRKVGTV